MVPGTSSPGSPFEPLVLWESEDGSHKIAVEPILARVLREHAPSELAAFRKFRAFLNTGLEPLMGVITADLNRRMGEEREAVSPEVVTGQESSVA